MWGGDFAKGELLQRTGSHMKVNVSIPHVCYLIKCKNGGRLKVRPPQRRKVCFRSTVGFIYCVILFNPSICFDLSYWLMTTESSDRRFVS